MNFQQTSPRGLIPSTSERAEVAGHMRDCHAEIVQAVRARSAALLESARGLDPELLEGQRAAASAAVDYGIEAVEFGEARCREVPAIFHAQARLTARSPISLDTMMRRYFAGYVLLGDFLMREADQCSLDGATLQCIMRDTAAVFDRLISTVAEEYQREARGLVTSPEERLAARVRALLSGELLEATDIAYEFHAWHVGVVAVGDCAADALRRMAQPLDRRPLLVRSGDDTVWAWFGGRTPLDPDDLDTVLSALETPDLGLAMGEPAHGLAGWRLTHRQAQAVLPIVRRSDKPCLRYSDGAVVASLLQDDLLSTSLQDRYLSPLACERDGGESLRETLRAYFAANRNASSAAAALGVNRQTVANRLRTVEERVDRPLTAWGPEVEVALTLYDIQQN